MSDDSEPKVWMTYAAVAGAIVVLAGWWMGLIEKADATMYILGFIALAQGGLRRGQTNDAKKVKRELVKQQEVVKEAVAQAVVKNEELEERECEDRRPPGYR